MSSFVGRNRKLICQTAEMWFGFLVEGVILSGAGFQAKGGISLGIESALRKKLQLQFPHGLHSAGSLLIFARSDFALP